MSYAGIFKAIYNRIVSTIYFTEKNGVFCITDMIPIYFTCIAILFVKHDNIIFVLMYYSVHQQIACRVFLSFRKSTTELRKSPAHKS